MRNKGDWMILLAAFIGGGGFIAIKYLLDWGYTPFQIMLGRFLIATACIGLVYYKQLAKITKKEWRVGGMLGILLAATFFLITTGLQYTTPSVNAFLCNIPAVLVPFICWIAFKERPSISILVAAFFTVIGVAFLSVTPDFRLDLGAILSLGAALAFALQMAFMGKAVQDCDSVRLTIVENITVTVVSILLVVGSKTKIPAVTLPAFGLLFGLGAFCTAVYFVLLSVGQRYTSANKTAIIVTTESIFAAIISALFYNERLTLRGYIGCAIIFLAMLLAELPAKKSSAGEEITG